MNCLEISQLGISAFGSAAFLLVIQDSRKAQSWGVIFGILSNPFWWAMVIETQQWLTIPVHALYTFGWLDKARRLFMARTRTAP